MQILFSGSLLMMLGGIVRILGTGRVVQNMNWPHDPDGEAGSEGRRKYGLAIFAKKLEDVTFPVTATECEDAFGDDPIRLDHETVVSASEILTHLDKGPYEDRQALLSALGRTMRDIGQWPRRPAQ